MRGKAGVIARPNATSRSEWKEPIVGGQLKHRRFVWIKRGGVGKTSGSGPTGRKTKPARLLARLLADRAGAAAVATKRQEARLHELANPPRIIW